ncbi:MAG: hypothetical protein ACRDHW_06650 [Ktedonobacteraceae bacterium]
MKNTLLPETSKNWLSSEMLEAKLDRQDRLLGWWYRLTAVPEPPASATFLKREAARRMRSFSVVSFFFLLVLTIFIPACFFLPNHFIIYCDVGAICAGLFTLILNRQGMSLLAGILLVITAELALTLGILTTLPMDEPSIQLYDLYLIIDLLAVSLMPAGSIFLLALCNSLFIGLDLIYQPHMPGLQQDLAIQLIPMLVRPIGLQIMIAGVAYLWVRSSARAITRADRAEMIANLEHTIAEERSSSELARKQLEESIEQLVKIHTEGMNKQMVAKVSYPPEAKILWPLIGVINSLWVRLQHAHQTEYELYQLKQAIAMYAELLRRAQLTPQQPIPLYQTKTDIDTLMFAVRNLQATFHER